MITCPTCSTRRPDASLQCPLCHPVAPESGEAASCPEIPIGTLLIKRYEVRTKVSAGEGAVSAVYFAHDLITGLDVALKFPPTVVTEDEQQLRLFCKEATVCLRLTHENIVRVWNLELSPASKVPFLVMEYVPGPSLGRVMIERYRTTGSPRIDRHDLIDILSGVARALDYAHSLKIVHRDIKPSNILLTGPLGQAETIAKLADFGIAAQIRSTVSQLVGRTPEGNSIGNSGMYSAAGTLPYMSPEQIRGRALSPAADIYSLAATIYHLVAGRPPFTGNEAELICQIAASTPPPIPGAPDRLNQVIEKALSKAPEDRPPGASAFVEAVAAAAGSKPLAVELAAAGAPGPGTSSPMRALSLPPLPLPLVPSTRAEMPRALPFVVEVPSTHRQIVIPPQKPSPEPASSPPVAPPPAPVPSSALSSQWPEDPVQRYNLGSQLAQDGRPGEAVSVFRSAIDEDHRLAIAWYKNGSPLGAQLNWEQIVQAFRRAVEAEPGSAATWLDLGFALARQLKWPESIDAYRKAVEVGPDDAGAWSTLADALCRTVHWKEAEAAARRATELAPRSGTAWRHLGTALGGLRRWSDAQAACRRAVEIDPKGPLSWINLADVLNWQGQWTEAAEACRKTIDLHGQFARGWDSLAIALGGLGRWSDAEAAVRRALELDDSDPITWGNLADTLNWQGQFAAAETACRKAVELGATYGKAWNSLGVALGGQGRWNEAEPVLRKALQHIPRDPEAWVNLASALNWLGRFAESVIACRKAIDLAPLLVAAWESLGYAEERVGNGSEAERAYRKALQIAPGSTVAQDGLKRSLARR